MNQVTTLILVAVISILGTAFVVMLVDAKGGGGPCDIHPQLTDAQMSAMRANVDRARTQAFNTLTAGGKDKDAANSGGDDAAFDMLVHDLRGALSEEYLRHRRSLDGCF
jgi:hypothetical protein